MRRDRPLILFLVGLAMLSTTVALILGVRLIPTAGSPDGDLVKMADDYATLRVLVAWSGGNPERLDVYLSGPAAEEWAKEKAQKPAAVPGLKTTGVGGVIVWRAGDAALVEETVSLSQDGKASTFVEHYLMRYGGTGWTIAGIWRIDTGPKGPLVPVDTGSDLLPTASTGPIVPADTGSDLLPTASPS